MDLRIVILVLCLFGGSVDAQSYGWLTTISPGGNEYCWDVATDDFGNFFGTGRVKFTSTFGTAPYTTTPPMIGVETDVFLAKYRKNGQLVWAKRHGGTEPDWGRCVIADKDGNAIIAGDYCDYADFDTIHIDAVGGTLNRNIFVAKYDSSGNCLWAKTAGNTSNYSRAYAITVDVAGNVYAAGHISGPSNFDGIPFGISAKNVPFIAKFSPSGTCLWVKHISCGVSGQVHDITYNSQNNKIYATGGYRGSITINSVLYPGNSPSWDDVFTVEMDPSGNFGWTATATGGYLDLPYAVDFDTSNNIYIAGTFANDLKFGTTIINSQVTGATATIANAHLNGFLAKYSSSGAFQWVKTIKSDTLITLDDIVITETGKILLINSQYKATYFQTDTIPHDYEREKSVLTCYDLNGAQLWHKVTGTGELSVSHCVFRGVAKNKYDDIILGGEYAGTFCYFDTYYDPSASGWDAFLAKLYMPLDPNIAIEDSVFCLGDTVILNISQEGSETEIEWQNVPPGLNFISFNNPFIAVVTDTFTYQPTIKIANPADTQIVVFNTTLQVIPNAQLSLNDTVLCPQTSLFLTLDTSFQYAWYDGDVNSTKLVSDTGQLWVTITNSNNCSIVDSLYISHYSISSNAIPDVISVCSGDSAIVSLNSGFSSPVWYDGSTMTYHYFNLSGYYTVAAQDINSCQVLDSVFVNVDTPQLLWLGNDTSLCLGNNITLTAPASFASYSWSTGSFTTSTLINSGGSYWLSAMDTNGCVSNDTVIVAAHTPNPFSIGTDTVLCPDQILLLTAPGTHNGYVWSNGETTSQISIDTSALVWLSALDSNGCVFSDTLIVTSDLCVGYQVNKPINETFFSWPNPFQNTINIDLKSNSSIVMVYLYNLSGEKLYHKESYFIAGQILELNIGDHLPGGSYYLVVQVPGEIFKQVIVKQ